MCRESQVWRIALPYTTLPCQTCLRSIDMHSIGVHYITCSECTYSSTHTRRTSQRRTFDISHETDFSPWTTLASCPLDSFLPSTKSLSLKEDLRLNVHTYSSALPCLTVVYLSLAYSTIQILLLLVREWQSISFQILSNARNELGKSNSIHQSAWPSIHPSIPIIKISTHDQSQ